MSAQELENNRDAVITIQGGGVFGLTLLGQLQAVIEKHRYNPLALAGTSAGAIVATLVWAGLQPGQIRNEFVEIASKEGEMVNLLGPFKPIEFDLAAFRHLKKDIANTLSAIEDQLTGTQSISRWNFPRRAWDLSKTSIQAGSQFRNLKKQIIPHITKRGFFDGEQLERKIEQLLRSAPGLDSIKDEPLQFRHFTELMKSEKAYRPPLMLTATNLTTRRLEIISSVDPLYQNVPVAKAVRASAGFPVFFTPKDLPGSPYGGWYVDGGVVSNFPVWAFSDAFRQQMQKSDLYSNLTPKPWIRIGLRVIDDGPECASDLMKPAAFFGSLASMLTGRARNQLEEILSSLSARSLTIKQPIAKTAAPSSFLDLDKLDATKVESMIDAGFTYADEYLDKRKRPGIYKKVDAADIQRELQTLVRRCVLVLNRPESEVQLRGNVFIPVEDRMKLLFGYNMAGDDDEEMEFPDLHSGLTGFSYMSRKPQICNLSKVDEVRKTNTKQYQNLFGMPPQTHGKVAKHRTWLASVPVFDPYELRYTGLTQIGSGASLHKGLSYHGMEIDIDGAVLGVLNIDAGWDYATLQLDPDPDLHYTDERIQAILALMQSSALSIARILSESFVERTSI